MEEEKMENQNLNLENEEEMEDVEIWEYYLDVEEIDELISKLTQLKQTKRSFEFDIDGDHEMLVHYDDPSENENGNEETESVGAEVANNDR